MTGMRILLTQPSAELYGSDRMALTAAQALANRGHSVTVAVPTDGPLLDRIQRSHLSGVVIDIPVLRKSDLRPTALLKVAWRSVACQRRMFRLIRITKADVVYVNTIVQPWWIVAARMAGRRVIVHVREAESQLPHAMGRLINAPLLLADAVLCNSRSTQSAIGSVLHGIRTQVVYNGKDWSEYQISRPPYNGYHPDTPLRLAVIGRLSPRKGQDIAVRSLAEMVAAGVDASLTLVGDTFPGYEWYTDELRQLVSELELTSRVDFTGFLEDVRPVLQRTDIAVVPSRIEPFGTVAAECMAAGLLTIAADVQGLSEIVEDGRNGLTFRADDSGHLAARCLWAVSHWDEVAEMSRRAERDVRERFSLERYERAVVAAVESPERVSA